jgi:hypothetical protein
MKAILATLALGMLGILASCNHAANASSQPVVVSNGIAMPVVGDITLQDQCRIITAARTAVPVSLWKGTHEVDGVPYEDCWCVDFSDGTRQASQYLEPPQKTSGASMATITLVREYPLSMQDIPVGELKRTDNDKTSLRVIANSEAYDRIFAAVYYGKTPTIDNPITF